MPAGLPPHIVIATQAPKAWWCSKTLWLNAAVLALAGAESQLNVLQPLLPINVYSLVAFGLPIVNAVLRLLTSTGVALRSPLAEPSQPPQEPQP